LQRSLDEKSIKTFSAVYSILSSIIFTGCTSGSSENKQSNINAAVPSIISQPQSAEYIQNVEAAPLTVEASVDDNGTLSYQWYFSNDNITWIDIRRLLAQLTLRLPILYER
jgi:hypothetical protein